jgi:DNA-binding NtrC family response regulator
MNQLNGTQVALWTKGPLRLAALENALSRLGCEVRRTDSFARLSQWVTSHAVDLVVTWLSAEDQDAVELVTWLDEISGAPPVLLVYGALEMDLYLEVMRRGAFDCIGVPVDKTELARIVGAAVDSLRARQCA